MGAYSSNSFIMPELPHLKDDSIQAIKSLDSRKYIPLNSTAVSVWAGTLPYYRPDIDFVDPLGKMDKYISRTKPRYSFFPGHTKWDWNYTLSKYKPMFIFKDYENTCVDKWLHNCTNEEIKNYKYFVPGLIIRKNNVDQNLDI